MIDIEMKLVCALGEGRIQLECMCGHQFTFAPADRINCDHHNNARCPKCQTVWNGSIDELSSAMTLSPKFFSIHGRVADSSLERLGIGMGVDMLHFAVPAMTRFCTSHEPTEVVIKRIDKTEYERIKEEIEERVRTERAMGFIGMIAKIVEAANDGGSDDQDDRDRPKE